MNELTNQANGSSTVPQEDARLAFAVWDRVIRGIIYAITFLLPLLFTPWTFEPLEFSKQMLLYVLVSGGIIAWLLKLLITRSWRFVKTPLDLPIAAFLVVYLLASLFSIDRVASFLGYYGSFSGNFFQVFFLALFYYLVVNNFPTLREIRRLAGVFLLSGLIAALFTVLQFFGVHLFRFPFAKVSSFNTIGSLLAVSLFSAFAVIFATGLRGSSWFGFSGKVWRIAAIVCGFIVLLAINFVYAWVALLAGLLAYLVFQTAFAKEFVMKNFVGPLVLLVLVVSLLVIQIVFPFVSVRSIFNFQLPVEVRLDYTTAGPVLKGVLASRPVLGTGPGTFLYAFSEHRDEKFNLSPFWNVRFDKAPSEAAEQLVGSGALGFLAFEIMSGIFLLYGVFFLMRKKEDPGWNLALTIFSSFLVLWVAHFFFFFTTVIAFTYWLLIAAFVAVTRAAMREQVKTFSLSMSASPRQTVSAVSIISLALVIVVVFLFFATSVYASDIFFRKGIAQSSNSNTLNEAQANFERAIRLNRFRPDYYLTYSEFLFLRINRELATRDPNLANIQSWLASSINTSRAAVNLSPANWTAWERLANLYSSARPLVAGVDKFIIESLTKATETDNKNPILFTELGQVYRLAARRIDPEILGKGVDTDQDGLSDEQERVLSSDFQNPDTNGNNVLDGNEVLAGLNPAGTGALSDAFLGTYIRVNQENLLKAEQAFRKAISLKEDYAAAYYQLALTLEQSGKVDAAINELEQALQKFPREVVLKFDLGRMYFNTGKVDLSARQFQEILTLQPTNANVRFSLALSYERLGNTARALAEYKKVLETNQENETIKEKIRQLEAARDREPAK